MNNKTSGIAYLISPILILCLLQVFASCGAQESTIQHTNIQEVHDEVLTLDTIVVQTTEELIQGIRSNRLIKLTSDVYSLPATLHIDSIHHLTIVGTGASILKPSDPNTNVLHLTNCDHIKLDSLKLVEGKIGLKTKDVTHLSVSNSEITGCSILIFELEKSRHIKFQNTDFHHNILIASVLGGFTYSTHDVTFLDCDFVHNIPKMPGNPAFNLMENYTDFDKPIVFTNCTFKDNKGFKWYGKKFKLNDCQTDSSGIMEMP
ncbi:MAG: right-handed parallel beta-helix repeat-containing protein [Bacteroidia bacterium]